MIKCVAFIIKASNLLTITNIRIFTKIPRKEDEFSLLKKGGRKLWGILKGREEIRVNKPSLLF